MTPAFTHSIAVISPRRYASNLTGRCSLRRPGQNCTQIRLSASHSDVIVVGAGLAGLSTAFELARRGANVRVLSSPTRKPAGQAAAGMLAPNSEILSGANLDICRTSLDMYPTFISTLRNVVPEIDVCFQACNQFLLVNFEGDDLLLPSHGARTQFLSNTPVHLIEPALGPRVTSATHVLDDASVDNRLLMRALHLACERLGVQIEEEPVRRFIPSAERTSISAVLTKSGKEIHGGHIIVACGAWTKSLLPNVPLHPLKGQALSLVPPPNDESSSCLQHILCGRDVYIIPKQSSAEYIVGATVERAGFCTRVTAGGISKLLQAAISYVPAFADYEISETWTGLRPVTPDLCPIFGLSEFANVSVVSGFHRNGVLLAPVASHLASSIALGETDALPSNLRSFLDEFSPSRFFKTQDATESSFSSTSTAAFKEPEVTYHATSEENGSIRTEPATSSKMETGTDSQKKDEGTGEDAVKMYRILKDGTKEPIHPPPGWKQGPKNPSVETKNSDDSEGDTIGKIMMYRVLKDGTREPVLPPPGWKQSTRATAESVPGSEARSLSDPPQPEKRGEIEYEEAVQNPENISAVNDAYDDVLQNADNGEEYGRIARAKNRAFGRKKSRLETDGSPVLSLSEEEVDIFDNAFQQGLSEMNNFAKHFDANDASVLATKKDQTIAADAATETAESPNFHLNKDNINGVSVIDQDSRSNVDRVNWEDPANLSQDGYF